VACCRSKDWSASKHNNGRRTTGFGHAALKAPQWLIKFDGALVVGRS